MTSLGRWRTLLPGAALLATWTIAAAQTPLPLPGPAAGGAAGIAQAPAGDLAQRAAQADRLATEAFKAVRQLRDTVRPADEDRAAALASASIGADRLALVGAEMTPLVTTVGSLESKLIATDPRWAGAIARQLAARGVGPGSAVCASFSGSFPGLNVAVMAAVRSLGARLVAVSSVTASSWGANQPGLTWPEMEAAIVAAGVMPAASLAVSLGGTRDAARDLTPEAQALARGIQETAAGRLSAGVLRTTTLAEAIAARLDVYRRALGDGRRPVVYVNVGGNHASLGGANAPLRHDGGWLTAMPEGGKSADSVLHAYLAEGVPVLSLLNIKALAIEWGPGAKRP